MYKIILLLFGIVFFLDFSFMSSLLGSKLNFPYFTLSLISLLFIMQSQKKELFFEGIFAGILLNILMPLHFFLYLFILGVIWLNIYFLKNIIIDENLNLQKINLGIILFGALFGILFFWSQNFLAFLKSINMMHLKDINWFLIFIKFCIWVVIYNLLYKLMKYLLPNSQKSSTKFLL